jgi:hypothetical protein
LLAQWVKLKIIIYEIITLEGGDKGKAYQLKVKHFE